MAENEKYPRTIPEELHQAWGKVVRHGDIKKIAGELGYSIPIIQRAISYGHVKGGEIPDKINKFFMTRIEQEKGSATQLTDADSKKNGGHK